MLSLSTAPFCSAATVTALQLQLYNDSACTVLSPVAGISQPVPADGVGVCLAAPASLVQAGYSSYFAGCGTANNNTADFAIVNLWSGPASDVNTCNSAFTTTSLRTSLQAQTPTATHNATSCVGPFTVNTWANYTTMVSATTVYAQFTCRSTASHAPAGANFTASSCLLLLMLLCVALTMMA